MTDEELKQIEERQEKNLDDHHVHGKSYPLVLDDISALLVFVKQLKDSPYCGQCGEPRQDGEDETCRCSVVAAFAGDKTNE